MPLPNGPMEVVLAFDATASTYNCMSLVYGKVSKLVQQLQSNIPGIRFAVCIVLVYGAYIYRKLALVTKFIDFTDDAEKLGEFVDNVQSIVGNEAEDSYDLILHQVRAMLSWTPGSQRALIMFGEQIPHVPDYPDNMDKFDWRKEASCLGEMGVRIYSVQCSRYTGVDAYYKEVARRAGGHYLQFIDYQIVGDCIMAVCYREKSLGMLDAYEKEVIGRSGGMKKELADVFTELRDGVHVTAVSPTEEIRSSAMKVVTPGISPVSKKCIKGGMSSAHLAKRVKHTKRMRLHASLYPYVAKNLPRLRRENVPECNFILKNMPWTKWQLAISPLAIDDSFRKRIGSGKYGFRKTFLFRGKTNLPALYEVAVQTKSRTRKYAMYSKCCRIGFVDSANWEKSLLGRRDIRAQVNDVVGKNCNVFIRRVLLKGSDVSANAGQALAIYDYAWKGIPSERKDHRKVTKMSVDISKTMHS